MPASSISTIKFYIRGNVSLFHAKVVHTNRYSIPIVPAGRGFRQPIDSG